MPVKDMRHKTPMGSEPLSSHHVGHSSLLLRHIPDMMPIRIHNYILVGLLKPTAKEKRQVSR